MQRRDGISQGDTRPAFRGGGRGFPNVSQKLGPTRRRLSFISAFSPGVSSIKDVWAEVDGQRVDMIEPGTPFTVRVSFIAENAEGLGNWSTCITISDSTGNVQNWRHSSTPITGVSKKVEKTGLEIKEMGKNVMPDSDLALTVKLWANDAQFPSPKYPPEELWAS